jgi:hypothetical protein
LLWLSWRSRIVVFQNTFSRGKKKTSGGDKSGEYDGCSCSSWTSTTVMLVHCHAEGIRSCVHILVDVTFSPAVKSHSNNLISPEFPTSHRIIWLRALAFGGNAHPLQKHSFDVRLGAVPLPSLRHWITKSPVTTAGNRLSGFSFPVEQPPPTCCHRISFLAGASN